MSDTPKPRPVADLGRLIEVLTSQAETSRRLVELIESRSLPLLERIAEALERSPVSNPVASSMSASGRGRGIVELRIAIDEARWDQAESISQELTREHPGDPAVAAMAVELDRTRQFVVEDLRQRIEAARQANDPEGAIGSRDELARIIRGEALLEVDRALVRWLLTLIQRRLRTGTIRADVVALAARVAESFGGTTEGASLRASLPTLRRSAGLCPQCAEPYTGVGEACPKCLAASATPTPIAPFEDGGEIEPEPEDEGDNEPIDLNNERFWQDP